MIKIFEEPQDDIDFMSELEAATNMRPAVPAMMMLYAIAGLALFAILWAGISQVEQITHGQGRVVPTSEIQVVQSLEGGILSEVLVAEGDMVKKGQVLMRLSDVQSSSKEQGTEARLLSLRAKRARLQAETKGIAFDMPEEIIEKAPQVAATEKALYESRQKELKSSYGILDDKIDRATAGLSESQAQVGRLSDSRKHLNEELNITREMVAKRAVSKLEQIRLERELSDISGQINAESQKVKGLQAELEASRKERATQDDRFRSQALEELGEVEADISGVEQELKSLGDRVDRTEIRSPVDGVINSIALKTIGGIVEPAMKLIEIVPADDKLKIVAQVKPDDIAFLRPGQDVKVKITAYDAQKYGSLNGKLVRIGANSVTDREGNAFFEIEVRTDKNYMGSADHPLPITPGMVAQTEVITGKRTILTYLLKPVLRARDKALTER